MSDSSFLVISILLFAWIVTAILFLRYVRSRNAAPISAGNGTDVILGLMSQKAQEAENAEKALELTAKQLNLGIIQVPASIGSAWSLDQVEDPAAMLSSKESAHSRPEGQAVVRCIGPVRELLQMDPDEMAALVREFSGDRKTIHAGNRVIDIRKVELQERDLFLLTDITEGFLMAKELKEKERLALLGQMSGQVAHKIKTPLSILAGRAQLLARRLQSGTPEKLQAEGIYQEARDLAQEIDEIIRFYRYQRPEKSRVNICEIVETVVTRLNALGSETRAEVQASDKDQGCIYTITDRAILENALYLIAQNSLDPWVHASRVVFAIDQEQERLKILIEDDGDGIPEEVADKIFKPFFTTREDGIGLGLFMASDLLERIGGKLRLINAGDKSGASFEILLYPDGYPREVDEAGESSWKQNRG